MKLTLTEPQKIMVAGAMSTPRHAIWGDMGLGKTAAMLTVIKGLRMVQPVKTLILGTPRVITSVWPAQVELWDEFKNLTIAPIIGTPKKRAEILAQDHDIYTLSYQLLPWLVGFYGSEWPFKIVIADESTRLKSFRLRGGSKRAKALAKVSRNLITHLYTLTGTPSPQGLMDLWGQLWFIDHGETLGTFSQFLTDWFECFELPYGVKYVPKPRSLERLSEKLASICTIVEAKNWYDLKKPVFQRVSVKLSPEARALYDDMENEALKKNPNMRWYSTHSLVQAASGFIYTDEGHIDLHFDKMEALEDIREEAAGSPLVVVYFFIEDCKRLQQRFPDAVVLDRKKSTIERWNAGEIPMLLIHATSGHGIDLQYGGHRIVFYGIWWSVEDYLQMIERIGPMRQLQAGFERPVYVYVIEAEDTIDQAIIRVIHERDRNQQALKDYVQARKGKPHSE